MINLRKFLKRNLGSLAIFMVGRKQLLRLSRYFLNEARLDGSNNMEQNGELLLQGQILKMQKPTDQTVYLDVGANIGDWTKGLLRLAPAQQHMIVYCFEPSKDTAALLRENLRQHEDRYQLLNKAVSNTSGIGSFFIAGKGLGINLLHQNFEVNEQNVEEIELITLDQFVSEWQIPRIHLMKIDAEGHDFSILEGALDILEKGRVDFVQFEYSWRWIDNRKFLKDVFELTNPIGYDLGKVTNRGIEFYDQWDPDLETFVENNYLLCKRSFRGRLKEVTWWK